MNGLVKIYGIVVCHGPAACIMGKGLTMEEAYNNYKHNCLNAENDPADKENCVYLYAEKFFN